jgi:hypothetical protein
MNSHSDFSGVRVLISLNLREIFIQSLTFFYFIFLLLRLGKTSLKITKGQSEPVYRRRTDNTMAERKSTKGQTTINNTYI